LSNLVFFIFNILVFLITLLRVNKKFKLLSYFILYLIVLCFIKYDFYSDLVAYKDNIEENSFLKLEPGWEFITRFLYSYYNNTNFVLFTIILFNVILTINLISKLNLHLLESKAFSLFLITKWFLYTFVVIRFGLASLIMLNLLAYFETREKRSLFFIILCIFSCLLHYSIIILIFVLSLISIKNTATKITIALFSLIPIYFLYSKIIELDTRVLRYFDVYGNETNYNWMHIFIMSIFSIIILYNYFKMNKNFDLLMLFILAISNIIFQPFDAVNRIVYVLIIFYLFKAIRLKIILPITSYYLIILSIIFLIRYSIFAPIDKSWTF